MYRTDPKELGERLERIWQDQKAKNNLKAKSKRSFALSIGADASYFNRATEGKGLSDDYIAKIVEQYGVSEEWLRFGKGEMYGHTSPKSVPQGTHEPPEKQITPKAWENLTESVLHLSRGIAQGQDNIAGIVGLVSRANSGEPTGTYSEGLMSDLLLQLGERLAGQTVDSPGKFVAYAMKVLAELQSLDAKDEAVKKPTKAHISPESQ